MNEEQAKQIQEGIDNLLRVQEDLELASNTAKSLGNETAADIFDNINIRAHQASEFLMAAGITVEAQKTLSTPTPQLLFPDKDSAYNDAHQGNITCTERLIDNQPEKKFENITVDVYVGSKGFGAHFSEPEYADRGPFSFIPFPYTPIGAVEELSNEVSIEITDVTAKRNSDDDFVWVINFKR